MTALDKLKEAKELLARSEIEDAAREAETIIAHCLKTDRATLYRDNPEIQGDPMRNIERLIERRAEREPLQYILGHVEFFGLKIKVGRGVLIPRPETELLAEEAIKIISNFEFRISNFKVLDLCTGSGCLALVLAKEFPEAQVFGTDTSEIGIQYANENAGLNKIKNVTFKKGSLFEPVKGVTFDLIVSNPPYIRSKDIIDLQPEIKDWEPRDALDGGEDGLDYYRSIIPLVKNYLRQDGFLVLELGVNQADVIKNMAEDEGLIDINLVKDYAGIDRICIAKNNILVKNKAQ
jgi:release factor glutamine methyltransferase